MKSYFLLLSLLLPGLGAATDLAREQRLAEQIEDAILDGEPLWLEVDGQRFFSILTEADEPRGAVLLHGMGAHPDWADIISPLRIESR